MKKILQITIAFLCFNIAVFADAGSDQRDDEVRQKICLDLK